MSSVTTSSPSSVLPSLNELIGYEDLSNYLSVNQFEATSAGSMKRTNSLQKYRKKLVKDVALEGYTHLLPQDGQKIIHIQQFKTAQLHHQQQQQQLQQQTTHTQPQPTPPMIHTTQQESLFPLIMGPAPTRLPPPIKPTLHDNRWKELFTMTELPASATSTSTLTHLQHETSSSSSSSNSSSSGSSSSSITQGTGNSIRINIRNSSPAVPQFNASPQRGDKRKNAAEDAKRIKRFKEEE